MNVHEMNLGFSDLMDERVDEIEYATIFIFNLNFPTHFLNNFFVTLHGDEKWWM